MFKNNTTKTYKEDVLEVRNMICNELKEHQELIEEGNRDSSDGSDDAPSDDNLNIEDI